jgi:hypothetical protein
VLALVGAAPVLALLAAGFVANRQRVPEAMLKAPAEVIARTPGASREGRDKALSPTPKREPEGRPRLNAQSYEEFLSERLMDNPKEAAARAYLAVIDRLRAQPLSAEDEQVCPNQGTTIYPGEPVTPRQAEWLRAHGELIECLLRFCESGPLPGRSRDELLSGSAVLPFPNIPMLERCIRLLQAEATRRAGAGDDAGAERIHLALLRMAANLNHRGLAPYRCQAVAYFRCGAEGLGIWLKNARLDRPAMARLRQALGALHADVFAPGRLREYLEICYTEDRRRQLDVLNAPWILMAQRAHDVGELDMRRTFLIFPLYRVDRLARLAWRGMHYKYEIPRLLGEYDHFWKQMLERSQLAYPDFAAAGELRIPADNPIYMIQGDPRALETLNAPERAAEARLNLCRAALERRAAPAPQPDADMSKDRENPWRDPFTERPLRVREEASGTSATALIYSLGPDMKDQGGAGTERNVDLRIDRRDSGDDLVLRINGSRTKPE